MNIVGLRMLRPQDVLVVCKLHALGKEGWTFVTLADSLGLSTGETHNAIARCKRAGLVLYSKDELAVARRPLYDLIVSAVPRIFYVERGRLAFGIPTAQHADPLRSRFKPEPGTCLVWAYEKEKLAESVKGETIEPLYPSVPEIVRSSRDPILYELLALIDVVRVGDGNDRKKAKDILAKKIIEKSDEGGS